MLWRANDPADPLWSIAVACVYLGLPVLVLSGTALFVLLRSEFRQTNPQALRNVGVALAIVAVVATAIWLTPPYRNASRSLVFWLGYFHSPTVIAALAVIVLPALLATWHARHSRRAS
jgi:cytochrome bd-type quinol oxidase subunit 2